MRRCPPRLLLPPASSLTLPPGRFVPPPPPPSFPPATLLPLPLLWLPRLPRPRAAGTGDGSLGTPVPACTPPDAQPCPPRAGVSPQSPVCLCPAPSGPQLSLVREAAGGARGGGGGGRRAGRGRGEPRRPGGRSGWADSSPLSHSPSWEKGPDWDPPPSRGHSGSSLTRGQGAPNLRVT